MRSPLSRFFTTALLPLCLACASGVSLAEDEPQRPPPLPIEETGHVETLPSSYPESWVMVDEASFFNMYGGKVIIVDVLETQHAKRIKGMMHKNFLGNFAQHTTRPELYIMESFHERGWRGKKTDVLAIYDRSSLELKKEIFWPTDRLQMLPTRFALQVSGDKDLLFGANFNPAASITVVELHTHEITDTIGTPGCVMTFPTGKRSVSSLCSNGGMLTTVVGKDGKLKSQHRMEPFFDTDKTPIFERPMIVDGIAYFPSFTGDIHAIDLNGERAKYLEKWSLLNEAERAANWRPSGLALNDVDDQGLAYMIMHENGAEGTQSHGGVHVWVLDLKNKKRLRVIDTPNHAISVAVTRGKKPKLVVTNGELNLDVFDAQSGEFIQTIGDFGNVTPLLVYKSY